MAWRGRDAKGRSFCREGAELLSAVAEREAVLVVEASERKVQGSVLEFGRQERRSERT